MAKFFSFRGRVRRLSFLKFYAGLYLAGYLCITLLLNGMQSLHANLPEKDIPALIPRFEVPQPIAAVLLGVAIVGLVGIIWMNLAVDVRRLHDIGLSGWFVLLSLALAKFVPDIPNSPDVVPSLGNLIWDAAMLLIPGRSGINVYGEDPRRRSAANVF